MAKRKQAEAVAEATAGPILEALGLELLEVAVTGPARSPILRLIVDRPDGGVTVDELQAASTAVETALEVAEVLPGRYNLEVSSPGIDRPWKRLEDFRRHVGERVSVRTVAPLADGRRSLVGRVIAVEDARIRIEPEGGETVSIEFSEIAGARPEIDWTALLRGRKGPPGGKKGEQP